MAYRALLEYVRKAKELGASDHEVIERLCRAGWYRVDAQDAVELYHRLVTHGTHLNTPRTNAPPKPSFFERLAPRHYDAHLIAISAISFVVGFFGYLWLAR